MTGNPLDPLLAALAAARQDQGPATVKLATCTGSTVTGVLVRFDGETTDSPRSYLRACEVLPVAGQRVVMLQVGSTWVVDGVLFAGTAGGAMGGVALTPSTGTGAPGATTGTAFFTPAGVLTAAFNVVAWTNVANGSIVCEGYLDGVFLGYMTLSATAPVGAWVAMSTLPVRVNVTAGTHYAYARLATGSGIDRASLTGVVLPA